MTPEVTEVSVYHDKMSGTVRGPPGDESVASEEGEDLQGSYIEPEQHLSVCLRSAAKLL